MKGTYFCFAMNKQDLLEGFLADLNAKLQCVQVEWVG